MSGLWRGWISLEGGNGLYTGSFSLWNGDSGLIDDPVEGAAPVLTAPTLTLTSSVGRRPVTWNSSADETIFEGYVYRLQVATNSDRTGIVQDISHDIVGGELNGASSVFNLSGDGYSEPTLGTKYYFARYERDDGEVSAWSSAMTVVVYDFVPSAFSSSDLTNQAVSTLVYSDSITVLGVSAGATCNWTVAGSGFEARVNGTGSWATSGTCQLNDTIQRRGTTSASNSTALNGVLDIEGVTDTWTIETEALGITFDPAVKNANITLSNGDLTATGTNAAGDQGVKATDPISGTGTYHFDITYTSIANGILSNINLCFANAAAGTSNEPGRDDSNGIYFGTGTWGWEIYHSGGYAGGNYSALSLTSSSKARAEVNMTTGDVKFYIAVDGSTFVQKGSTVSGVSLAQYYGHVVLNDGSAVTADFTGYT